MLRRSAVQERRQSRGERRRLFVPRNHGQGQSLSQPQMRVVSRGLAPLWILRAIRQQEIEHVLFVFAGQPIRRGSRQRRGLFVFGSDAFRAQIDFVQLTSLFAKDYLAGVFLEHALLDLTVRRLAFQAAKALVAFH